MEPRNERDFFRIVIFSTALGFGAAVASLYSLRAGPGGFRFEFTFGAVVAFMLGALVAWQYWRLLLRLIRPTSADKEGKKLPNGKAPTRTVLKFIAFSVLLFVGGVAAFLYPLRYVSSQRFPEIVQGLLMAFLFLGCLGLLFWKVTGYLREDSADNKDENPE